MSDAPNTPGTRVPSHGTNRFGTRYAYDFLHYLSDPRKDVTTMYVNNHFRQHELYFSAANMFSILPFWSADISVDFQ